MKTFNINVPTTFDEAKTVVANLLPTREDHSDVIVRLIKENMELRQRLAEIDNIKVTE